MKKDYIYLCTILADTPYKGYRFRLDGKAELTAFGFSVGSVKQKLIRKQEGTLLGVHLKAILVSEFVKNPSLKKEYRTDWKEVSLFFKQNPVFFRQRRKFLIGEVVEGPYLGEVFVLHNAIDVAPYFCVASVRRAAKRRAVYGSVLWRHAENKTAAMSLCRNEDNDDKHDILFSLSVSSKQGKLHKDNRRHGINPSCQSVHYLLVQAQAYLSDKDDDDKQIEGIIVLHRALGIYQTDMAWQYKDTLLGRRFEWLMALLSPDRHRGKLDVVQGNVIQSVIGLLVKKLSSN